jgi:hypothetical protein
MLWDDVRKYREAISTSDLRAMENIAMAMGIVGAILYGIHACTLLTEEFPNSRTSPLYTALQSVRGYMVYVTLLTVVSASFAGWTTEYEIAQEEGPIENAP